MIKLVAIDVDDTLLTSQGTLLESTKQAVKQACQMGIKIVLCTGRPLVGVQGFLQELQLQQADQYAITFNGAVIQATAGQVLTQQGLTRKTYEQVDAYAKQNQLAYNVLDADGAIYTSNRNVNWVTVVQAWENQAGVLIREPQEVDVQIPMIKAVFVGEKGELDQQEAAVQQQFGQANYVVRAADNFLEMMHADINKGVAVQALAEHLRIDSQDILVLGDEQNDLPMFEVAGTSVAMGNGSSVAKQAADYTTASNDEDGIMEAFQKFIFRK
ncbi:Cof-type HAD-IIB family hydrolase [Bombilactobacillus folatiphilus]|uniref:Cof-type HAD-IIB family hydrolase n=1 Tax=Bombilactobacillus folatiphilus TaxID=2923362 RepID=A0ABY4PA39_9LACO|nr:Cof-type HAD-IIB family hydrolase [Bombilactobacillus folatiphilus]UQS82532.1 Cof-type HAD-IIB family hydrolase [Bombilactobacillus folatiphilus]